MYDWLRKKQREFYVLFCVAEARGTNKLAWDYDTSIQFVNWLERTGASPWPAMCCPDCGGTGDLGTAPDGRQIACETCGGHEDSLGRGFLLPKESE